MKSYLECIPCFFKQALDACEMAGVNASGKKNIIDKIALKIPGYNLETTPPEMGREIHGLVRSVSGVKDPYKILKEKSHKAAWAVYHDLRNKIRTSRDPLREAVDTAIAGNIIDYGAASSIDLKGEILKIVETEQKTVSQENPELFKYEHFREASREARSILYLGDNVGETVMDSLLIEEIKAVNPDSIITYAVRGGPIINDALTQDAEAAGINRFATIISNGYDAPATILKHCSSQFNQSFETADLIISKGQGNYESLSETTRPVFFLFMAKCPVIVRHLGCRLRDVILKTSDNLF